MKYPNITPKTHWFWGNTKQFAASTLGFVQKCMLDFEKICHARIGFRDFYLPLDADLADYVLRINNKNYKKSFAYSGLKIFLGKGLLTNEGKEWLTQRRMIQPAFYKEAIQKLDVMMQATSLDIISSWNGSINLTTEINKITRTIICKAVFGNALDAHKDLEKLPVILNTFRVFGNDSMKNPLKAPLWVPNKANKQFKEDFATFEKIIYDGIQERRKSPDAYQDLLALLIHLKGEAGEQMTDKQVFDEIATIFIAGQETTTNALLFTLYLLDTNPEKKQKLLISLQNGETDYLRHCINESFRLLPPAWAISREAIDKDVIGGIEIEAGDTVFIPIYAFHRNHQVWENADNYLPERFEKEYPKKWFMPFGDGPRFCIGNHFAQLELEIVLKNIFLSKEYSIENKELNFTTLMTLAPKEIIWAKIH